MKINKYWYLTRGLKPTYLNCLRKPVNPKVWVIHYPEMKKDFIPIVLAGRQITSRNKWGIKKFYSDAKQLLNLRIGESTIYTSRYSMHRPSQNIYFWGCRHFTRYQLKLIIDTMEQFYTPRQLGVKK